MHLSYKETAWYYWYDLQYYPLFKANSLKNHYFSVFFSFLDMVSLLVFCLPRYLGSQLLGLLNCLYGTWATSILSYAFRTNCRSLLWRAIHILRLVIYNPNPATFKHSGQLVQFLIWFLTSLPTGQLELLETEITVKLLGGISFSKNL